MITEFDQPTLNIASPVFLNRFCSQSEKEDVRAAIKSLKEAVWDLSQLFYESKEQRDLLRDDIGDIAGGALSLTLIFSGLVEETKQPRSK